jgi:hypothetical protein
MPTETNKKTTLEHWRRAIVRVFGRPVVKNHRKREDRLELSHMKCVMILEKKDNKGDQMLSPNQHDTWDAYSQEFCAAGNRIERAFVHPQFVKANQYAQKKIHPIYT